MPKNLSAVAAEISRRLYLAHTVNIDKADAYALAKAERTLHRWCELESGDGNAVASWAIERDETTGKPYRCIYRHDGSMRRYPTPDRERGALRTVAEVCRRNGLHFYHQGDPRGCALYVSAQPLTDTACSDGVACCCSLA